MITHSRRGRAAVRKASTARQGFSLIEIMVALTLLALVLSSLARLSLYVAVRARGNDAYAKRAAVLQLEANKLGALPMNSFATWSTIFKDSNFTVNGFTYKRRITVSQTSSSPLQDSVKVVIIPSTSGVSADSAIIVRTKPNAATALCSGC